MRVLVGCEESGVVRRAFRGRGHIAYSCDLLPARDNSAHHIRGDVELAIQSEPWDLIILHPDCRYLAVSGNRWYADTRERAEALTWTEKLWRLAKRHARHVCLEQPISVLHLNADKQIIHPWQFGHPETKATTLWTHNLPPLEATDNLMRAGMTRDQMLNRVWKMAPSETRARDRATTYLGIADAFAAQWGNL